MLVATDHMARVIAAEEIVLPGGELRNGPHYVTIDGDRVVSIATKPPVSCSQTIETHLLVPGLIDLHTHGLGQYDIICHMMYVT